MRRARKFWTGEALACAAAAMGALWLSGCASPPKPRVAFAHARETAETCRRPNGPEGTGIFVVAFGTDGVAREAQIRAGSLSGTPTAECVLRLLRAERIAPFDGYPAIAHGQVTVGAPDPPGQGNVPIDRGAAASAIGTRRKQVAASCRGTGAGHVSIYFFPTGEAATAVVDEGDAGARAAATCVEKFFLETRVPAFSGPPVSVGTTFEL